MRSCDIWCDPPRPISLDVGEVHVWRASTAVSPILAKQLRRLLSAEERARADRIRGVERRREFVATRARLRVILASYRDGDAMGIEFRYGRHGKPYLSASSDLFFNASHSKHLALYAICRSREVGIDVEQVRVDFAYQKLAERFFSPREVRALRSLPRERRRQAFYRCWTSKEAYLKARGDGLSFPLGGCEVRVADGMALIANHREPGDERRWLLEEVDVGTGYVAVLAVEREPAGADGSRRGRRARPAPGCAFRCA